MRHGAPVECRPQHLQTRNSGCTWGLQADILGAPVSPICVWASHDFTTQSWPLNLRCKFRATDVCEGSDRPAGDRGPLPRLTGGSSTPLTPFSRLLHPTAEGTRGVQVYAVSKTPAPLPAPERWPAIREASSVRWSPLWQADMAPLSPKVAAYTKQSPLNQQRLCVSVCSTRLPPRLA